MNYSMNKHKKLWSVILVGLLVLLVIKSMAKTITERNRPYSGVGGGSIAGSDSILPDVTSRVTPINRVLGTPVAKQPISGNLAGLNLTLQNAIANIDNFLSNNTVQPNGQIVGNSNPNNGKYIIGFDGSGYPIYQVFEGWNNQGNPIYQYQGKVRYNVLGKPVGPVAPSSNGGGFTFSFN